MKKRTRNILIILTCILVAFTAIVGYGIYSVYSVFSKFGEVSERDIPAELKEARILAGNQFLIKTEFFKLDKAKTIQTIAKGSSIKDEKKRQQYINSQTARGIFGFDDINTCGNEIIAVGKFGGFAFDKAGNILREITFEPYTEKISVFGFEKETYRETLDNLKIHDFEGDGKCEFFSYSSVDGVVVFDKEGNAIWRYGEKNIGLRDVFRGGRTEEEIEKEVWITGAFAGDLNNDGVSEMIVTRKNDGIRAFDIHHKEIWFQPDEFPTADYKIFDFDGDGKNDVLELQGASSFFRNAANGEKIKTLSIESGSDDILMSQDKDKKATIQFLKIDDNKIKIFGFTKDAIWESDAPLSEVKNVVSEQPKTKATPIVIGNIRMEPSEISGDDTVRMYKPRAVFVKLKPDEPEYLAVVGSFISIPRSHFYIYDENGKLVYHELLPENAETIAVLNADNGKQEILVGGKNSIWRYGAN